MDNSLKYLLQKSINKAGISKQVDAAVIIEECNRVLSDVLGSKIKDKARAMYVRNGTVSIAVTSSTVGQEIKLHEEEILAKLVKKAGQTKVEKIRFLV